jgi:hypothetical protein
MLSGALSGPRENTSDLARGRFRAQAAGMTFGGWRAAWNCAECRLYRRLALAFAAAAACSLMLW